MSTIGPTLEQRQQLSFRELQDELHTLNREILIIASGVPVPPDAFTLFCQAKIAEGHSSIPGLQGKQQDINKELAYLWSTEPTGDDGSAVIDTREKEDLIKQEQKLWAKYRKSLDLEEPLDFMAQIFDDPDFDYGWFFFRFSAHKVLNGFQSDLLLSSMWTTMLLEEKVIYEMRGRKLAEIVERSKNGELDVDQLENLDELYSYLPMSTYARLGIRAREHWDV
ncbi:hypothetical protein EST38_g13670 [Candolleomyces aberdarensis]|uniref:Uncharacterized protein n=1 Tax=Candolleomyces aberdarensis TaxID=2316362 RepID=A0A4Q2CZC6_9AGAR|nr:hypothetical protein EST38_g13670 [Candolleomyces aberdarensis]